MSSDTADASNFDGGVIAMARVKIGMKNGQPIFSPHDGPDDGLVHVERFAAAPTAPPAEPATRDARVGVRLSPAELARLQALADSQGSTPSALIRSILHEQPEPGSDAESVRLRVLLNALDGLGLPTVPATARATLARVEQMRADATDWARRGRDARAALVQRLAEGEVGPAEIAAELSAWSAWSAGEVQAAAVQATTLLHRRAVSEARTQSLAIHKELGKVAAPAIAEAVEHGSKLCDVPRIARDIAAWAADKPAKESRTGWPADSAIIEKIAAAPVTRRGDALPPDLDPVIAAARASALNALKRIESVMECARLLAEFSSHLEIGSRLFREGVDPDEQMLVARLVPEIQIAVAHALGWEPGLRAVRHDRAAVERQADQARQLREDLNRMMVVAPTLGQGNKTWWE